MLKHQLFGRDDQPTIYYVVGYGNRIKTYRPHIKILTWLGYRVMAFEYGRDILMSGDPKEITRAINKVAEIIKKDQLSHKTAGIYGISLGAFISFNVMLINGIKKGTLNSGASNLKDAIWNKPGLIGVRRQYKRNGFTPESTERVIGKYEFNYKPERFKHLVLDIQNSRRDRIIDFNDVKEAIKKAKKVGADIRFKPMYIWGHGGSILRSLFRIKRLKRFFG